MTEPVFIALHDAKRPTEAQGTYGEIQNDEGSRFPNVIPVDPVKYAVILGKKRKAGP